MTGVPRDAGATVVGSGPNGLAAAVVLALNGLQVTVLEADDEIGGGTRTSELTVPGLLHDHCSAVHPFGIASPFFRSLGLEQYGLEWLHQRIDLAHPLDDAAPGVLVRDLDETAKGLGEPAWRRLFGPLSDGFPELAAEIFGPIVHLPRHPVRLTRFGINALQPAGLLARRFGSERARALFGGVAAHAIRPLESPTTASVGLLLIASAHRYGWPVAKGGSRSVTDALARLLREHGGTIETGVRVTSLAELPSDHVVMLDLAPGAIAELAGEALPARVRRAYRRWKYGPGSFKLDLAVEGGIPWRDEACRQAGTVHVGGTLPEIAYAEREVAAGRMPQRPFVLVGQQYLADPQRSNGEVHPVWAYCHVPHGYPADAGEAIIGQVERFAPGFRERIVGRFARDPAGLEAYNANYVGGDIGAGANTPVQMLLRPRVAADPYSTGIPGVYVCSAATPPGAGVHGMCGANAARSAIRELHRVV
jgi:phytoene dehydrogenase-like protein